MNKKHLTTLTIMGSAVLLGGCINQSKTDKGMTPEPSVSPETGMMEQNSMSPTPSELIGQEVQTEATYQSPAGTEKVGFKLTVDGTGLITSAEAMVEAVNETSKMRQEAFAKDFPIAVVGKKIADLSNIDRVGGSSLTTKAFNSSIKDLQAKASM